MKFETQTSTYELTQKGTKFVLRKITIRAGKTSIVQPGQEYIGDSITMRPHGLNLYDGEEIVLKTSALILSS